MFINITDSQSGTNTGSSARLVHYLDKEARVGENRVEAWFNCQKQDIPSYQVKTDLDSNVAKLSKSDAKFFLLNISPSEKEIAFLKSRYDGLQVRHQLKQYAIKVMNEYAKNFNRPGIKDASNLLWFGKLENNRYYTHKDKEVKTGFKKRGEIKSGEHLHIQVIVSRKDINNSIKLSPMNKSRGRNQAHSKKVGQFDRSAFKQSGERVFDQFFGYERGLNETYQFYNANKQAGHIPEQIPKTVENVKLPGNVQQNHSQIPANDALRQDFVSSLLTPTKETNFLEIALSQTSNEPIAHIPRKRKRKKGRGQDQGSQQTL